MSTITIKELVHRVTKLDQRSAGGWNEKCRLERIIRNAADESGETAIGDCYDYAEAHPDQEVVIVG